MEECVSLHYTEVPAQPWDALGDLLLPLLPGSKRDAIMRLKQPADRNASLLGIALLGAALAERATGHDLGALEYPAGGKPRLAGGPDFSIAHAAGYVGCAVATNGRVGFDLEACGAVGAGALRRALGVAELAQLARGALEPVAAWVMTEAVLKAAGRGIAAAAAVRLAGGSATLDGARFQLAAVALEPTHVAFVAHEGDTLRLRTVRHGPREFAPLP